MTSYTILQNNDEGVTPYINFGGFLLGNPSTDHYENVYGFVGDIHGHGLLKSKDWYTWRNECWDNSDAIDNNLKCAAIHTRAYYAAFNANVYALDYPQCVDDEDWDLDTLDSVHFMKDAHLHRTAKKYMKKVLDFNDYKSLKMGHIKKKELQDFHDEIEERLKWKLYRDKKEENVQPFIVKQDNDKTDSFDIGEYEPCIDHFMATYLNLAEVQKALNVKTTKWEMCSGAVWDKWPDSDYDRFIEPYYTEIVNKYIDVIQKEQLGLTLAVFSGDDDSVCGLQGTLYWLDRMEWSSDDIVWKQWSDDDKELGGFYTQYLGNNGNVALHFLTVRSAGHMVPTTEPSRALHILRNYLHKFRSLSN